MTMFRIYLLFFQYRWLIFSYQSFLCFWINSTSTALYFHGLFPMKVFILKNIERLNSIVSLENIFLLHGEFAFVMMISIGRKKFNQSLNTSSYELFFFVSIRYYYINPHLREKFFRDIDNEEQTRDIRLKNNQQTMIVLNVNLHSSSKWFAFLFQVRQWLNSAFEMIECILYEPTSSFLERMLFYLTVYGKSPSDWITHLFDWWLI